MKPRTTPGDLANGALWPFLLISFGIAWGLFAVFALFILAVYAPAIAAVSLVLGAIWGLWPDAQPHDSAVFLVVAAIVIVLHRRTLFSRADGVTRVLPAPVSRPGSPTAQSSSGDGAVSACH
jgi:hypothetical protein